MCKLLKIAQDIWAVLPSLPSRERGLKLLLTAVNFCRDASLPSRERGLKLWDESFRKILYSVAPLAGAWIEIAALLHRRILRRWSLPSRERGLKSAMSLSRTRLQAVAPLAGAWIEIIETTIAGVGKERRSPRGSVD